MYLVSDIRSHGLKLNLFVDPPEKPGGRVIAVLNHL